nr:helix-turn-helix domain-containing protein [Mesorhizobium sp.]
MTALAAHPARRVGPVEAFGTAALALRDRTLRRLGVSLEEVTGSAQRGPAGAARQELAYLLWTECLQLSLGQVAKLIGRGDHSAAIHAILAGARRRGIMAARVSDLRESGGEDLDWIKLAYQAAGFRSACGLTQVQAAARAGISRTEWRKVENGRAVSAATLLRICRAIAVDPLALLPVTHETAVKHDPAEGRKPDRASGVVARPAGGAGDEVAGARREAS